MKGIMEVFIFVVQILFICNVGECQDINYDVLLEVLQIVTTLDTRITSLKSEIEVGHQSQMKKMEAIETRLGTMEEGTVTELKEMQNITLQNQDLLKEGFDHTCKSNEVEYINQSMAIDVDECQGVVRQCGQYEKCVNEEGSFSCVSDCESPSQIISGFGCVTPVLERSTWDGANKFCKSLGGNTTLLQGITSQAQMNILSHHFNDFFGASTNPWIGLRQLRWIDDDNVISSTSTLWKDGYPKGGAAECGDICLHCSRPSIRDYSCSATGYFLCQWRV